MKNIKNIFASVLVGSLIITVSSCEKIKDFGTTNVNPNGSSEVLTSALLTNVEAGLGGNIQASLQPGLYCQYFAEPTYPGTSLYTLPQLNSSGFYSGPLMDLQVIINRNTDPATAGTNNVTSGGANKSQIAISRILQSYYFWVITDRWGDLPYAEALKGADFLTPKYDDQQEIYKGIISQLTAAIALFDESGATVKGDVIYSGNIAKWRKAANSLRMLVALRLSKRFPGASEYAATEFAAALNSPFGYISTNADNFTVAYPGGNYRNPWFSAGGSADNGIAQTFTDALTGLGDNRVNSMCSNSTGVPYGLASAANTSVTYAKIFTASLRAENSPLILINAASVLLAKAEAFERGWAGGTTATAQTAYEDGVKASFDQWGQTIPANYLTTGAANYTNGAGVNSIGGSTVPGSNAKTPDKLSRIALQQWLAFYPDGTQGWANWRRTEKFPSVVVGGTGVPDLRPTVNAKNTGGKIVRRYVYGTSEYSLNKAQLDIAIAKLTGGDSQDARVWWDKP